VQPLQRRHLGFDHLDLEWTHEHGGAAHPERRAIVGGDPRGRGVVATANYNARKFGIHSAMSCAEALRRCPQAVFVRPRHSLYREYSRSGWEPVRGIVPATTMVPDETPCGVEIPSYEVALRGRPAARHIWTACGLPPEAEGERVFVSVDGHPNCHGHCGAGGLPPRAGTDPVDWIESIPFSETRNYVQRVLENTQVYRHRLTGQPATIRLSEDLHRGRPN